MRKMILVEKSFPASGKNPKHVEARRTLAGGLSFAAALIESLTEACEHAEGKRNAVRVQVVDRREPPPDRMG